MGKGGAAPREAAPLRRVLRTGATWSRRSLRGTLETRLPCIDELMLRQAAGAEQAVLSEADAVFHRVEFLRLRSALADSAGRSRLPETAAPATRAALNDLRVRPGGARAA